MKKLTASFLLSLIAIAFAACDDTNANTGNPDADAAESRIEWMTDYELARELSREAGKPVLMNFTGSDWCPPCIQMKSDVLDTSTFQEYAKGNLVLLELDFPRQAPIDEELERQNEELASSYGVQGFPTFVVIDGEGEELRRSVGYTRGGPDAFIAWIED